MVVLLTILYHCKQKCHTLISYALQTYRGFVLKRLGHFFEGPNTTYLQNKSIADLDLHLGPSRRCFWHSHSSTKGSEKPRDARPKIRTRTSRRWP